MKISLTKFNNPIKKLPLEHSSIIWTNCPKINIQILLSAYYSWT